MHRRLPLIHVPMIAGAWTLDRPFAEKVVVRTIRRNFAYLDEHKLASDANDDSLVILIALIHVTFRGHWRVGGEAAWVAVESEWKVLKGAQKNKSSY